MMITPEQIRAARALKNWSQSELATRTGLATPTIANIELGKQDPGIKTIIKIKEAFTVGGVAFTQKGVELIDTGLSFIEGHRKYHNVMLDALSTLTPNDEILFLGADAKRSPKNVSVLQEKLENKGITSRKLICEGNIFIQGDNPNDTRHIKKELFSFRDCITIYKDKVITSIPEKETSNNWKFAVLQNQAIADDYRRIFDFIWKYSTPMTSYIDVRNYNLPMEENYTEEELEIIAKTEAISCS